MSPSRILLAAPEPRLLASHQAFLTRLGYDVAVATDGLDCVARLRHDRPDLLVLALELPWGGEGVLALMADGELPPVPVVLLAESTRPPRLVDDRYPVRSFLSWPAPPRLLARSIRGVLTDAIGRPSPEAESADDWSAVPVRPRA